MKKAYCDICKKETPDYQLKNLSYVNTSPCYNGSSSVIEKQEICTFCNERLEAVIKKEIQSLKEKDQ